MNDLQSKAEKYAKLWHLDALNCIAKTPTSYIYEAQHELPLILKVFTDLGIEDEGGDVDAFKTWKGRGAVKVKEADAGAVLIERLYAPNLYSFLKLEPGNQSD